MFFVASLFLVLDVMSHSYFFIDLPFIGFVLFGLFYKAPISFLYFGGGATFLLISSVLLTGTNDNALLDILNRSNEIIAICVTSVSLYFYKGAVLKFKQAYECTTIGKIIVYSSGDIKSVNPTFEKMIGYSNVELIGENITKLMPDNIDEQPLQFNNKYKERGIEKLIERDGYFEFVRKDGKKIPLHLCIRELYNTSDTLFLASISDLTELKKAKDKAVDANLSKTQFISNMSHELKTPLNAIIGFSELIKYQSINKLGVKTVEEYVDIIHTSGTYLLSIINDILDLSKAEIGAIKLSLRPVNLKMLIQKSIDITSTKLEANNNCIYLSFDENISKTMIDNKLLLQVMINLLSNAGKFTENGNINVQVKLNHTHKNIIIDVQDTGIGIDEKNIYKIFDRFFMVDGSFSKNTDGSGLGLSIVNDLVKIMNGSVFLESTFGEGALFTITLPYLPVQNADCSEGTINNINDETQEVDSI